MAKRGVYIIKCMPLGLYRFFAKILYIMKQKCTYNPLKDIQNVVPGCAPDLNAAVKTGQIPDTGVESVSNGLEELSDIGHRVREPFDVIHFDRVYAMLKAKADDNKNE